MDTKALKKQMGAAIAMVLVAAVALGSATFAWFMNNNKVTAKTSNISAQSNAPSLKIDATSISKTSGTMYDYSGDSDKALYPAQVVKESLADASKAGSNTATFVSAYASDANKADELDGSRYVVGNAETAVGADFAIEKSFVIGTSDYKAGSFKNLKVNKVTVTAKDGSKADLKDAMKVLLVCGDNWAVYSASENGAVLTQYADAKTDATGVGNGVLASTISAGPDNAVTVKAYVFYDGSQEKVTTNKLDALKECNLNIEFSATPVNTQGKTADAE